MLPCPGDTTYHTNSTKGEAELSALFLKRYLMKDEELLRKYRTTMNDFIERRHAERVSEEELNATDRPVWYLPHHPVTHPLKPGKVRVVIVQKSLDKHH